jgi:hypothetical protein
MLMIASYSIYSLNVDLKPKQLFTRMFHKKPRAFCQNRQLIHEAKAAKDGLGGGTAVPIGGTGRAKLLTLGIIFLSSIFVFFTRISS